MLGPKGCAAFSKISLEWLTTLRLSKRTIKVGFNKIGDEGCRMLEKGDGPNFEHYI
jgi:hypothetical protein